MDSTTKVDPIKKSDATPAPQTASDKTPAPAKDTPDPKAVGNAKDQDPSPPAARSDAIKKGKSAYGVWVQPGHETLGIGQLILTPGDELEVLRAAGRARYASEAEVKAGKSKAVEVEGV